MITVDQIRAKITTERKVFNPATRQYTTEQGKMTLIGVKITVTTPYGTSYDWKCYIRKGQPCSWKREQANTASRKAYYTEDEVAANLLAHAGIDGLDYMLQANELIRELCSSGHSVHPPIGV
jgi:hypothetical protein